MAKGSPVLAGDPAMDAAALAAGEHLFRRPWRFVVTVPTLDLLMPADRPEIAFAGRSNVGKSSLINAVIGQGGIARTSNTPGRTQALNYFAPEEGEPARLFLVDMPGYGYAKAPKAMVDAWTVLVKDYLRGRPSLKRVLLLIDSRHGIKANDDQILDMLDEAGVACQIVLTKLDKLGPGEAARVIAATEAALKRHPALLPKVLPTSAEKRIGIEAVRAHIAALMTDS
jgi:GTP-binding protein